MSRDLQKSSGNKKPLSSNDADNVRFEHMLKGNPIDKFINNTSGKPVLSTEISRHRDLRVVQFCLENCDPRKQKWVCACYTKQQVFRLSAAQYVNNSAGWYVSHPG